MGAYENKLCELELLFKKISKSKRHVKVEASWDGSCFKWSVTVGSLRAHELNISDQLPPKDMLGK